MKNSRLVVSRSRMYHPGAHRRESNVTEANAERSADTNTSSSRLIGKYQIIGKLGKGGMAEVLLSLQHDEGSDFKRLVVVKKILDELVDEDPQFLKMFLDEARLAARLSHPNIVQTFEVGEINHTPFLAMEFLDGQALNVVQRRAKQKQFQIPVEVALRIAADVLEALHYAHELKDFDGTPLSVIHRDVTPSNVFVKYDGLTKLVDFGIAKSATQREKTRAGTLKGKVPYMAPEQLRDEGVNRGVDVWAVGVVLWETLATERLFLGKNDFETVQNVMAKKIPLLSERRSDIPASLDKVIAEALDRRPGSRFQTALEFKERLEDEAMKMAKPLRASAVAKSMEQMFGDVMEQNKKLVRDFLEKGSKTRDVIRVRSTGTMEMALPSEDKSIELGSNPSHSLSRATGGGSAEDPTTVFVPPDLLTDEDTSSGPKKPPTPSRSSVPVRAVSLPPPVKSLRPPPSESRTDVTPHDDDDEFEPRPAWHWAVLVIALLTAGTAVYLLLLK